jgi:hypothetical protein
MRTELAIDWYLVATDCCLVSELLHHLLVGAGSLILAPSGSLPPPRLRITLPPENAMQAIGHDFRRISGDLDYAIKKVEHAGQLELEI